MAELTDAMERCGKQSAVTLFLKVIIFLEFLGFGGCTAPQLAPVKLDDTKMGQRVTVLCVLKEGSLPISFSWRKDGFPLKLSEAGVKISHNDEYQETLQIAKVSPEHVGNYTCTAKNSFGTDQISVSVLPHFQPMWVNLDVRSVSEVAGKTAELDCAAKGLPKPAISFFKGKSEVIPSHRILVEDGVLKIRSVTGNDKGEYECRAHNALGEIRRKILLALTVPARFKEKASVVTSRRSDTTTLKCYAVGDNPISVVWSKGNVKLDKRTSSRYEIIESMTTDGMSSELRIRETDRADSALYTCHTENKYGTDDRKVKLVVKDVPGAPQDVKVKDIWSRSVSLHWTPSYDGNSPITKFIVTYWRDQGLNFRQQELEVSSAQHFTLVRDLQPGTHYVLNVVAENVIGKSEASRTVTFTTNEEEPKCI